jgi:tetratricopeptide (TPR) repeat protein/tRNA A-37 threonylcarbamoyl transferase component Bud32
VIGTTIKDFKLIERLGKGGWGEVWAAEQPIVKTRVAIKLLRSEVSGDQAHVQRFFNEARAVGGIAHAGIVKIFDVGYQGEQAFLIMELLAGESLTARIRRETRLPLDELLDIGRQIASVLAATHEAGVVHRDLKPDNVFLVPDAEVGERVKILDFGIAKLATVNVTGTGSLGTPAYMAPEQWSSPATADHRADLYSLGCVLFEMCCGRPPFLATTPGEACTKHLTEPPIRARSLAPALPVQLDDLIDGLLAKRPDDRPPLADVAFFLEAAAIDSPRVYRNRPRASTPPFRTGSTGRSNLATAETLTSGAGGDNAATVTTLAGAVIAQTQPPVTSRRSMVVVGGLAAVGIAGAVAFAVTRGESPPGGATPAPVVEPRLGLATIADYRDPTPATLINHRSEQVWLAARDDFARACRATSTPHWCAGAEFATGQVELMRGEIAEAIAAFGRATSRDPAWSTGYLGLADAYSHKRDSDRALAAARKAQELDPMGWQPAMASARAYISTDEVDDALIEYRRAMGLSPPNNAPMLAEVALAFHYAGKDDEARKLSQQALALDKTLVNVRIVSAELALEDRDGAKALTDAEAALAVSPKNGAALIARGDALALLGRRDEALATYRKALQLRGGMNLLAISKVRLAAVEAAVERDELPVERGAPTQGRTPPNTEPPGAPLPKAAPSPRSSPTDDPWAERSPPADPKPTVRSPPRKDDIPPSDLRSPSHSNPGPSVPPAAPSHAEPPISDRSPPTTQPNRTPPAKRPKPTADRSPPRTGDF